MDYEEAIHFIVQVGGNAEETDRETAALVADIRAFSNKEFIVRLPETTNNSGQATKGDPITIGAIVLAAVGGGGALAKGFAPNGFFSKLAEIFRERVTKGVTISIVETNGRRMEISGSAEDIVKILKTYARRR